MIAAIAKRFGFIRTSAVQLEVEVAMGELKQQLQYAFSVNKRLDEHRELVEAIAKRTSLFTDSDWHLEHVANQDDYLMRLFHIVHGCWPSDERHVHPGSFVRPRPKFIRGCKLPEYKAANSGQTQ